MQTTPVSVPISNADGVGDIWPPQLTALAEWSPMGRTTFEAGWQQQPLTNGTHSSVHIAIRGSEGMVSNGTIKTPEFAQTAPDHPSLKDWITYHNSHQIFSELRMLLRTTEITSVLLLHF